MKVGLTPDELELRKFLCPEFIFGLGARHLVGQGARNLGGQRLLVVSDAGVTSADWPAGTIADLNAAGLETVLFTQVSPNPRTEDVMAGAAIYREQQCNALVAIGGGSPMDCAKGIGVVAASGQHILDLIGVDQIRVPPPPLICIPTTGGSAADVSQFAVFAEVHQGRKVAVISKAVVPDIALIDPETLVTMSPGLTATTGMDALSHAIESYVSNAHSPITDLHALAAIRLIVPNLPAVLAQPTDITLRGATMLASLDAGLAFSNASLGLIHSMSHSLGGMLDIPHGECNAILLNPVIAFNYPAAAERYAQIATAFGLEVEGRSEDEQKKALTAAIDALRIKLGLTKQLGALGVKKSDIPHLAQYALLDPCLVTNPRPVTPREIEALYEESL